MKFSYEGSSCSGISLTRSALEPRRLRPCSKRATSALIHKGLRFSLAPADELSRRAQMEGERCSRELSPVGAVPGEKRAPEAGAALCLSGGGYRAMLLHLGALRRLNEWGHLQKLARISSVSGGSITAA
jgi:predicted acylesterase/phospholipase RssA